VCLDLSGNLLGDVGAKIISRAFNPENDESTHNRSLIKLDLGDNNIGFEGAQCIANILVSAVALETIIVNKVRGDAFPFFQWPQGTSSPFLPAWRLSAWTTHPAESSSSLSTMYQERVRAV
jgi:hypothetical protein